MKTISEKLLTDLGADAFSAAFQERLVQSATAASRKARRLRATVRFALAVLVPGMAVLGFAHFFGMQPAPSFVIQSRPFPSRQLVVSRPGVEILESVSAAPLSFSTGMEPNYTLISDQELIGLLKGDVGIDRSGKGSPRLLFYNGGTPEPN